MATDQRLTPRLAAALRVMDVPLTPSAVAYRTAEDVVVTKRRMDSLAARGFLKAFPHSGVRYYDVTPEGREALAAYDAEAQERGTQ